MIEEFKNKLIKKDGRTLRWFHDEKIKSISKLTYSGFTLQLNGYAPISKSVMDQIVIYMGD